AVRLQPDGVHLFYFALALVRNWINYPSSHVRFTLLQVHFSQFAL
ncbi:hypothetical protein HMPREF0372_01683, partial [Flavonifractor plautii ATCC 29863]